MKKNSIKTLLVLLLAGSLVTTAAAQERKTEIWDFGGVQDSGNVINHLSAKDIDAIGQLAAGGRFSVAGEVSWGDLTVNFVNNDRMYFESAAGKSAGTQAYQSLTFSDGYTSDGMYYCNGTGGEKRRYLLLRNVHAGDVVTFYAGTSNTSSKDIHFAHLAAGKDQNIGTDILVLSGAQDEKAPIVQASQQTATSYSYIAQANGTYKIYTDSSAGKPVFYRIVRTPAAAITGTLTGKEHKGASLTFLCRETQQRLQAAVTGSSFQAQLAAGYTYTAVLQGVQGYCISADTALINLTKTKAGSPLHLTLTVAEVQSYPVTGALTGFSSDYNVSALTVIMTPPENSIHQPVTCKTAKNGANLTYSGNIEPNVHYTVSLGGANDYELSAPVSIEDTKALTCDLTVQTRTVHAVTGRFIGEALPVPETVLFTHIDDGYRYAGIIEEGRYRVFLRDGTYTVTADNGIATTSNHVVVQGKAVTKDINLVKKDRSVQPLKRKKNISVGGKKAAYKTIGEAIAAASAMAPKSEKERITIHIAPGVYREQLIIETPYITLKNDTPDQEVKLTWYYGIGYQYYSANEKGFYDADLAHDKFKKAGVARWGVATYVKPTATAFRAEGITFESSFNKYVCEEELADGVEPDGSLPFVRTRDSDVRKKKATERAAALCSEADYSEYKNCRFIGSQDTLYTGDNTHQYFTHCYIEGQTDFIFGGGDVLFDTCELSWCGYSSGENGGYITAARNPVQTGLVFYNCSLTKSQTLDVDAGYFGRPWGQNAKVAFINLSVSDDDLIQNEGWTKMSGNTPEKATFREYGTTLAGKPADTAKRVPGTVLSEADAYTPKAVLSDWKPAFFKSK